MNISRTAAAWVGSLAVAGSLLTAACTAQASASDQKDAKYWKQLTALLKPVEMNSMRDHRAFMTPDGMVVALHFDDMDLNKAQNLNWVAVGVPGKFTRAEQARVEKDFGTGFTHFHDMKADTHGGAPGADGVWFKHIAVRDFDHPMSGGAVKAGVDMNFMRTAPTQ